MSESFPSLSVANPWSVKILIWDGHVIIAWSLSLCNSYYVMEVHGCFWDNECLDFWTGMKMNMSWGKGDNVCWEKYDEKNHSCLRIDVTGRGPIVEIRPKKFK